MEKLGELQVVLMQASHGHGVDLDGIEAGLERRVDAVERLLQFAPTRDLAELVGVKRVERYVHAREPGGLQVIGHAGQKHPVRGHGDVLDARDVRDVAHQVDHAQAHERLPARQADAADAHAGGDAHGLDDLLDAQDLLMRELLHAFLWHAVDAPEVAAVRERYPEIVDDAAMRVFHMPPFFPSYLSIV